MVGTEEICAGRGIETYLLLIPTRKAVEVVDNWVVREIESELRIVRAKTPGHVVIITTDTLFARKIQIWNPGCQVAIKEGNRL